jgi:hypothetical protein
LSFFGRL